MIISKTPLRISFAGGGTDLASYYKLPGKFGSVLSSTINRYVYITANPKFDKLIRVSYSKTEIVKSVDDLEHNIVRESLKLLGISEGIEIVYMADLPLTGGGSGLGSSSALAVGVLNALHAYLGHHASPEQLACEAIKIERDILGYPVGKQDQYAAAYGGLNSITFIGDENVLVEPIACKHEVKRELFQNLILLFTGISRISSSILEEQQNKTSTLVHLNDDLVLLSDAMRRAIEIGNISKVGQILHEGWLIKQQLASGISNAQINNWYEKALLSGAKGGKIAGAGGGGFLLLYCEGDKREKVITALPELIFQDMEYEPFGSRIIHVSE